MGVQPSECLYVSWLPPSDLHYACSRCAKIGGIRKQRTRAVKALYHYITLHHFYSDGTHNDYYIRYSLLRSSALYVIEPSLRYLRPLTFTIGNSCISLTLYFFLCS